MGMGIIGFWYGNALSGLVPFLIGTVYLVSGKWKKMSARPAEKKSGIPSGRESRENCR
jgi:Na+-driven multidrug efflux pump